MKGPHFFEKRKKEMARQEKLKQKADRKAQRKAEKDRGEGGPAGEGDDDLVDVEGLEGGLAAEGDGQDGDASANGDGSPGDAESRQSPAVGAADDHARGS
ncbi:MAG: hypothetical protein ABUL77_03115 [Bacteroidota bacterium]